jgi:hypothetical protein
MELPEEDLEALRRVRSTLEYVGQGVGWYLAI